MSPGLLHPRALPPVVRRKERSRYLPRRTEPPAPTTVLLVRHGAHDLLDRIIVGRMPGVALNARGIEDSHRIARELAERNITRVYTSPRQRALETATIIARTACVPLEIAFALDEIDVGAWTGASFADLAQDRSWNFWNMLRSLARPPEGESMHEVQERVVAYLGRVHAAHPGGRVVLVSHAEVIRAAVMYSEGLSLDAYAGVTIPPAGVIEMTVGEDGARTTARLEVG